MPCHFQWDAECIIVSPLFIPPCLVCPYYQSLISFEKKNSVLDSYFIYRYIFIKYRSSSIWGKFHQLLWKLWPSFDFGKWFSFEIFWKYKCVGFIYYTQVYNHKIYVVRFRVKSPNYYGSYGPFSTSTLGKNSPIIMGVMALFQLCKKVSVRYLLERLVYWIHILYTGI